MSVAENLNLHPRLQPQLYGHDKAMTEILLAFENKKCPSAWLLTGPRGTGKATLAYHAAKKILTQEVLQPDPILRHISSGTYPNLYGLESEAITEGGGVEDVRRLIQYLKKSAPLPGWRCVIVDCVDELSPSANNALLKIVEEPPVKTVIFLIAHIHSKVLPTLRSRCRCLKMSAHDFPIHCLPESLKTLAPLGRYSLGWLQQLARAGGLTYYDSICQSVLASAHGNFSSVQDYVEKVASHEHLVKLSLDILEAYLYRFVMKSVSKNGYSCISPQEETVFQALSQKAPPSHWVEVHKSLSHFIAEAREANLDPKHLLMACFYIIECPEVIHV